MKAATTLDSVEKQRDYMRALEDQMRFIQHHPTKIRALTDLKRQSLIMTYMQYRQAYLDAWKNLRDAGVHVCMDRALFDMSIFK